MWKEVFISRWSEVSPQTTSDSGINISTEQSCTKYSTSKYQYQYMRLKYQWSKLPSTSTSGWHASTSTSTELQKSECVTYSRKCSSWQQVLSYKSQYQYQ